MLKQRAEENLLPQRLRPIVWSGPERKAVEWLPPDFLSRLVALIGITRFPLRETAYALLANAVK
jgi:hypothetical protein